METHAKVVIIGGGIHGLSTAWKLSETYKNPGDIVVSQLPANQHVDIAKLCLLKKCHFATSSYISNDMRDISLLELKLFQGI